MKITSADFYAEHAYDQLNPAIAYGRAARIAARSGASKAGVREIRSWMRDCALAAVREVRTAKRVQAALTQRRAA